MRALKTKLIGGLSLRAATPADEDFQYSLYRSTRQDLFTVDTSPENIESLIGMQYAARQTSYSQRFGSMMDFIVEKEGDPIGRVVVDFGHQEVRVIDVALIPDMRGKGCGGHILKSIQRAAALGGLPVVLVVARSNHAARHFYAVHGFVVDEASGAQDCMIWHPTAEACQA